MRGCLSLKSIDYRFIAHLPCVSHIAPFHRNLNEPIRQSQGAVVYILYYLFALCLLVLSLLLTALILSHSSLMWHVSFDICHYFIFISLRNLFCLTLLRSLPEWPDHQSWRALNIYCCPQSCASCPSEFYQNAFSAAVSQ